MDGSVVVLMYASVFYSVRRVRCQSKLHYNDTHLKRVELVRRDGGCTVNSTGRMVGLM